MAAQQILLVTRDLVSAAAIAAALRRMQMAVTHRATLAEGLEMLSANHAFDRIILDCEADPDIPETLGRIREKSAKIDIVLVAPRHGKAAREAVERREVLAVLSKPFGAAELQAAFKGRLDVAPTGRVRIEGLEMIDILQILHMNRRSVTVCVIPTGRLVFKDGEIVHAEYRGESHWSMGSAAFADIIALGSVELRTEPYAPSPNTIKQTFEHLLLSTLTKSDEDAHSKRDLARDAQGNA